MGGPSLLGGGVQLTRAGETNGAVRPKDVKATLETLGLTIHWVPGWALGDPVVLGTG